MRVYTRKDSCTDRLEVGGGPKKWGKIFEGCPIVTYGNGPVPYVAKGITDAHGEVAIIVPPTAGPPKD